MTYEQMRIQILKENVSLNQRLDEITKTSQKLLLSQSDFDQKVKIGSHIAEGAHAQVKKGSFNFQPVCVKIYPNSN